MLNCGVALTPKATIKLPPETETEIFRFNLLYGEAKKVYGLNAGIINNTDKLIGTQVGIVNMSNNSIGIQIGIINGNHDVHAGLKIGLLNFGYTLESAIAGFSLSEEYKSRFGISIGAANFESGKIKIGFLNIGVGFTIGLVNLLEIRRDELVWGKEKFAFGVGIVNVSSNYPGFQVGILNFCSEGPFPIMIVVNYCSKPAPEGTRTTEPKPAATKVDTKIAP